MEILSFISRQSHKKISVIELFPVRGKFHMPHRIISQRKHVLKNISITYIMPEHVRRLFGKLHS